MMKRLFLMLMMAGMATAVCAQPAKRRVTTSNAAAQRGTAKTQATTQTDRASLLFPVKQEMPEDVVWKRDIYRSLDLMKDANSPLYYPVEPRGRQVNLFTYLFQLMLTGRMDAYTYKLDAVESFDKKDRMSKDDIVYLMERFKIAYEEKNGRMHVESVDIPAAEVTRYYIKESVYLDQRTGSFSTRVTALCPVLMRPGEFASEPVPYPLFWVRYDDASPWLARMPIMASNLNNVSNMTAEDYFAMNRYDGSIYMTNNMQGRALANYCTTDSAMLKEQKKIEKQIDDFEEHVWGHMSPEDSIRAAREDSIRASKEPARGRKVSARPSSGSRRTTVKANKQKGGGGSASSGPARVSVRRQRR